ncbi:Eco29kI family restriction endonuclease [Candidatus Poribacteria bacterium]|nr:Eco29kI family restriction endonuclease [Candidatus Poribacteria bacterium]
MPVDIQLHTFRSDAFPAVVREAAEFMSTTPVHGLPPSEPFAGSGVYALYYTGAHDLYAPLSSRNRVEAVYPIYVGKAVPRGWRTARRSTTRNQEEQALFSRLREHARSIAQVDNLDVPDFGCRFMILAGSETDLIAPVESELIRRHMPLWNTVVEGFGIHHPGGGRSGQARSMWDVLHRGRPWAIDLTGEPLSEGAIAERVRDVLASLGFS